MSCTKPGCTSRVAPHGAAHVRLRLEHQHRPARVDEPVGRHQAVGSRADDDGVVRAHGQAGSARRSARNASRRRVSTLRQCRPRSRAGFGTRRPGPDAASSSISTSVSAPEPAELDGDVRVTGRPRPGPQPEQRVRRALQHRRRVVDEQGPRPDRVVEPRAHGRPGVVDLAHPRRADHPQGVEPPVGEHVPDAVGAWYRSGVRCWPWFLSTPGAGLRDAPAGSESLRARP